MRQKGIVHLFLLVVVILVAIGAIGYLAYQNAQLKKQAEETVVTPETTGVQGSPTTTLDYLTPTPTPSARIISYKYIDEWIEHDSSTGYSIQFPSAYKNVSTRMDAYEKGGCSTYANDGLGGIISSHIFPYAGGSRRELFYSVFGKEGYEYAFEEVLVSGINGLVIERGPQGDSGTGVSVVIPKGNVAFILMWGGRYRGVRWDKILGTIKIGQRLDISKCPITLE